MMIPTATGLIISQLVVKDNNFKDSVARTVGGIVPMIPEGLVLLTSVAFAIGVIRLGRKQCLVQELPAIEGLARVDVVCLDKTGTLTEGAWTSPSCGRWTARTSPMCARSWVRWASPTRPNASLQAIINAYPDSEDWRCTQSLPFSSARKYSGAAFSEGNGNSSTWLLGAPDVLLPAGDKTLAEIEQLNEQGLRVLLLARAAGELDAPAVASGATPTALVVLEQRLRPDASDTLRYFADQDVAAKVISGDNAVSVGAVAGKLGLPGAENTVDARRLPPSGPRWPPSSTPTRSSAG